MVIIEEYTLWGRRLDETILEARPGEDGVFRVDLSKRQENPYMSEEELERLREDINQRTRDLWDRYIFGDWSE